mmetsp:Transcript_5550/g.11519  ORF Transcript_5550/g.11519 Transcript_5550/m.11519 type:complete len:205 (-) Transcript_5550:1003-1617(-)
MYRYKILQSFQVGLLVDDWHSTLGELLCCSCSFLTGHSAVRVCVPRRRHEVWKPAALEVMQHQLRGRVDVRLSSLQQLANLRGVLLEEVNVIGPLADPIRPLDVLRLHSLEQLLDVVIRLAQLLNTHDPFQYCIFFGVAGGLDRSRAVHEVNRLHKRNVLPNLGLSRNRSNLAHLLLLERVDDGRLAHVRVPNEANGDLLLVRM